MRLAVSDIWGVGIATKVDVDNGGRWACCPAPTNPDATPQTAQSPLTSSQNSPLHTIFVQRHADQALFAAVLP